MNETTPRTVGRYRLDRLVGKGGMAEVYRATDTTLGRTVAVKMVLPSFASDSTFLERFLREARLVASLDHPNVLPIYDFGEQDGVPYLVMPHVEGGSLTKRIGVSGISLDAAASFIPQLADALDTAHAAGILHRDVKPSNVLLDRTDRPLLSDFGLARHAGASSLTTTGAVLGTPAYMAPELAQGGPASPATDRYALAIVAYEMLAARPPFDGETPLAILHQHVRRAAPAISTLVPSLPRELDDVFARALAKKPEERPRTCGELAKDVAGVLQRAPRSLPSGPARVSTLRWTSPPPPISRRPRPAWWIVTGGGLAAFLAIGLVVLHSRTDNDGPSTVVAREEGRPPSSGAPATPAKEVPVPPAETAAPPDPAERRPALDGPSAERVLKEMTRHLRRPRHLSRADFEELAAALGSRLGTETAAPLRSFATGGIAYASGDDRAARTALGEIHASASKTSRPAGLQTWLPAEARSASGVRDWELAAFYGDERGVGLSIVDAHLATQPGDLRARYGRMTLLHVAGEHRKALEEAQPLVEKAASAGGELAGLLLVFAGDELAETGDWKNAVTAYRRAARLGGSVAASAGFEGGQIAFEHLGDRVAGMELFDAACRAGQPMACRRTASIKPFERKQPPRRSP